jgi:hypothetical protein
MGHNPVVRQQKVGRLESFVIPHNTIGVLYQGERFVRQLRPGEGPSLAERTSLGDLLVYIIDNVPHTLMWRIGLPTLGGKDTFSVTISLRYQVDDPKRMVNERVIDTETLVIRSLEPVLRRESRRFKLNQFAQADAALEDVIARFDLAQSCGLKLVDSPDVVINLSEDEHRRIKVLDNLERAMRVARIAEDTLPVPTSERAYSFQVTVSLNYRVRKPEELPSDSLEEVEEYLWPKLRAALRRKSRMYSVTQIAQAEITMQETLDDLVDGEGIQGVGLQLLSAEVSADLDEMTREHYVELAQVEHATAVERAKLEGLRDSNAFYTQLIHQGSWAILGVAVSKGEISSEELYKLMSQQERERLQMQMELLRSLRAGDAKDELQDQAVSTTLLQTVVRDVTKGLQLGPALDAPDSQAQLTDGQKASTDEENK